MIAKLVDDLLHLERGGEGLDQLQEVREEGEKSGRDAGDGIAIGVRKTHYSSPDRPRCDLDVSLSEVENVVPESVRRKNARRRGRTEKISTRVFLLIPSFFTAPSISHSPRLKIVLHLGQVEVRTSSPFDELVSIVQEEEREVEDRSRHGSSVDEESGLVEVPASRSITAEEKDGHKRSDRTEGHKTNATAVGKNRSSKRNDWTYRTIRTAGSGLSL